MLFTSGTFIAFLIVVVSLHWLIPRRMRPGFLLAASYFFYGYWNPPFLLLIIALTGANYGIGLLQGRLQTPSVKLLWLSIAIDVGALGIFKYLGFFEATTLRLAHLLGVPADIPLVQLILPLGLSFFTFEFLHYQIEVYRGGYVIRDPIRFALFPAFFPTQIAGPIKRYQDFDGQVQARPRFRADLFLEGLELIMLGLFKKIVLADAFLAPIAEHVYGAPGLATGADAWVGSLAFFFQIYCDFSGYTDIARGAAQLLGIRIPINFNAPHLSTRMSEVWRRWHMSLSFWLRDYVFIPLELGSWKALSARSTGPRRTKARTLRNLFITVGLAGLWHGGAMHFVALGGLMGVALSGERLLLDTWSRLQGRLPWRPPAVVGMLLAWMATQLIFMQQAHLLRSPNLGVARHLWRQMLMGGPSFHLVTHFDLILVFMIGAALIGSQWVVTHWNPRLIINPSRLAVAFRPAYVLTLMFAALYISYQAPPEALINAGRENPTNAPQRFIYFQF